jgi:hypothetical protein
MDGMLFGILIIACSLPGLIIGGMIQHSIDREKFIMYCTVKGETYVNCSDIWIGKKDIK